jgi:hypothetical protein
VNKKRFNVARKNERQFYTRHISEVKIYPKLAAFPFPVQTLMAKEIRKCDSLITKKEKGITASGLRCSCNFYNMYRLPCRHIFYNDLYEQAKALDDEAWRNFNYFHEESGVEVWLKDEMVYVEEDQAKDDDDAQIREFKEMVSSLSNNFYDMKETKDDCGIRNMMSVIRNVVKRKPSSDIPKAKNRKATKKLKKL